MGEDSFAFPEMVSIPPGCFVMGEPSEEGRPRSSSPPHNVRIDYPFELGKYPVTFDEYDAYCALTGCAKPDDSKFGRGRRPIINVSLRDAYSYIEFLNQKSGVVGRCGSFRLPSESEWEYACRAGSTTRFSFGDDTAQLGKHAWFAGNATLRSHPGEYPWAGNTLNRSHPVGEKLPNAFGLYDMHGNVHEWCEDAWHESYADPGRPDDGSVWGPGEHSNKMVMLNNGAHLVSRGGSWHTENPLGLGSANRRRQTDIALPDVGFRVARTISSD